MLHEQGGLSALSQIQFECATFSFSVPSEWGKRKSYRSQPFYLYWSFLFFHFSALIPFSVNNRCLLALAVWMFSRLWSQLSVKALRNAQVKEIQLWQALFLKAEMSVSCTKEMASLSFRWFQIQFQGICGVRLNLKY